MRRFIGVLCSQWAWWVAMVVAAGLLAAGCGTGELRTVPLTASRTPFVRDIPVPMSFELVDDLSQSYRTQSHRVIRHAYFGQAEPITAYAFYKEQMPQSGWRFVSESNVEGTYQITFEKGSEVATVQIQRETRGLRAGALVTVRVKPIGALIGPN